MNNHGLQLFALVGMPGAGKSEAAQFFKNHQHPILRFGDQVDIGLAEQKLPRTEANERAYREELRAELGMAAMAVKIEPRILKAAQEHKVIVLDGLYSWSEYKYLKEKFPQLVVVGIIAPPKTRYERLAAREVRPLTHAEAQSRDYAEIENIEKGGPIAMADEYIFNVGTLEDLNMQLQKLYSKYHEPEN